MSPALTMMEDYLAEMKQDVSRLLTLVPRLPPVASRLNLSHTVLITKLTQQLTAAKQALAAKQAAAVAANLLQQQQQARQQKEAEENGASPTPKVSDPIPPSDEAPNVIPSEPCVEQPEVANA